MVEENGIEETTREVYEQAIVNVPPLQEKKFWRRYIYLWINYAIYEEMVAKDITCCRAVYKACIELIPHKLFIFAKIWIMFAKFEVRQRDLTVAQKVLGIALGNIQNQSCTKVILNWNCNFKNLITAESYMKNIFKTILKIVPHMHG